MNATISLPDDLSAAADSLAGRLGVSRSRLVALALAEFIAKHRSSKVTERLNAVYPAEMSSVERPLRTAQRRAAARTTW